jgi:hypothetical protein
MTKSELELKVKLLEQEKKNLELVIENMKLKEELREARIPITTPVMPFGPFPPATFPHYPTVNPVFTQPIQDPTLPWFQVTCDTQGVN